MRKINALLLSLCLTTPLISGCAGMADAGSAMAGIGKVTAEKSSFDDATIVRMAPAFLYDPEAGWAGVSIKLGGYWTSAHPEHVSLILAYDSDTRTGATYRSLRGMDISINGTVTKFAAGRPTSYDYGSYNSVSNTIYTQSSNAVVIPYALFEQMMTAKDVRLRISTGAGFVDAVFSTERIPGGQATAKLAFRKFVEKIEPHKPITLTHP